MFRHPVVLHQRLVIGIETVLLKNINFVCLFGLKLCMINNIVVLSLTILNIDYN